jgi:GH15 family glucan-1,4-alpha-glucosidase
LRTVYDVLGRPLTAEREIEWLSGFRGSRPVRIGNAAHGQLQLDCYGEVVAAASDFISRGGELDPASRRLLVGFGHEVCRRWREPDEGIWELRNGRRHNTHSKLLCWVALDRLLALGRAGTLDVPVELFERERAALAAAIEERGFDARRWAYVASFGEAGSAAALLLLARHGYVGPRDRRAIGTRVCIERDLSRGALVARYRHADGLAGREGAFGACCFWLVLALSEQGQSARAAEHLETLLACANDVGLFA